MPISFLPDLSPITPPDQVVIGLGLVGLAFIVGSVLRYAGRAIVADLQAIRRERAARLKCTTLKGKAA